MKIKLTHAISEDNAQKTMTIASSTNPNGVIVAYH